MMFDWNEQDQVGDTIWGEFGESEDHIVPHPREDNTWFNFGDYRKKKRNEDLSIDVKSTEQTSGVKNSFPGCNLENHSSCNANNEFSVSRLEMDKWPDLPNLSDAINIEYNDGNDLDSLAKELMNDLSHAPNLNSVKASGPVQLDGESELFSNEQADTESGIFLDYDWSNIGDFDDLDRIFRNNDSVFGPEMIGNADEFFSPSADVISSTAQSIPMPDIPLCNDQSSDQGCSSSQLGEHSDGRRDTLQKGRVDVQKKHLGSHKKVETRSKNKSLQNLSVARVHNTNQKKHIPIQKFHTSITTAPQSFKSEPVDHLCSSNQVLYTEYGYPTCSFPPIPHIHSERDQKIPIPVGNKFQPDPLKHSNSLEKLSNVLSEPVAMTPQEKIEKLRRRQKMQAMLAIQQQQQHYSHQITGTDNSVSQACSQKSQSQDGVTSTTGTKGCGNKLPSLENFLEEQEVPERAPMLIDDKSLEETIYYQLQDALEKLDIRVRLCIRDSLFRLARSAIERQSVSDGSSTNKSNKDEDDVIADEETANQDRPTGLPDSETDTNPIDRIVAHLLFHRTPESYSRSTKIPQSPHLQPSR